MPFRRRLCILLCVTFAAIAGVFLVPRIPQDPKYHLFADTRAIGGIPNFFDVVSNLPFLLAGVWGLVQVFRRKPAAAFREKSEQWPYLVFFLGFMLTCFGSVYYHWAPSNETLVWDRMAMAIVCMGILAATLNDRIGRRAGTFWLGPLLLFGICSVVYWHFTELNGSGDLRPYALVQFFTLGALPLLALLFPARYTHSGWLLAGGVAYVIAKGFEVLDRPIFSLFGISGHTLKHLAASIAALCIACMLRNRGKIRDAPRI
jgi:predicted membrane channel-forming protein YqfA (hemolysin III family)